MATIGNKESVNLLEYWLAEARKGDITYVAIALLRGRKEAAEDFAGAFGQERQIYDALDALKQDIEGEYYKRDIGPRNFGLDAAHVEWPLSGTAPLNWDFLPWLIDAQMTRMRCKAPAPLRVAFSHQDQLPPERVGYFERVHKPLVYLCGGIVDDAAIGGRHKRVYVTSDISLAHRNGEQVPRLRAPAWALEFVRSCLHGIVPVTITLREAQHQPERNSNIEAWTRFARELEQAGERVIFIRDTAMANEPLDGFATFPKASYDLNIRMALYDLAKLNCFVCNGPGGLGIFGTRPYLYFAKLGTDPNYSADDPLWWPEANGINIGDQWPWALSQQRMIWQDDSFDNLCAAWEGLCQESAAA